MIADLLAGHTEAGGTRDTINLASFPLHVTFNALLGSGTICANLLFSGKAEVGITSYEREALNADREPQLAVCDFRKKEHPCLRLISKVNSSYTDTISLSLSEP